MYDSGESGDTVVFGNSGESDDSGKSSVFLIWWLWLWFGESGRSSYFVAFADSGETGNSVESGDFVESDGCE